jgi:hypothetical protein
MYNINENNNNSCEKEHKMITEQSSQSLMMVEIIEAYKKEVDEKDELIKIYKEKINELEIYDVKKFSRSCDKILEINNIVHIILLILLVILLVKY